MIIGEAQGTESDQRGDGSDAERSRVERCR